jgi:hypothetical protein
MSFVASRRGGTGAGNTTWSRGAVFGWLLLLGTANGLISVAMESVHDLGWYQALLASFNVSSIVWIASVGGILQFAHNADIDSVSGLDLIFAGGCLFLMVLPIGWMSWLALTFVCIRLLRLPNLHQISRNATIILLAVTVPMLWSKLFFKIFAESLLRADAWLVALVVGTTRTGNMVRFVDGPGYLVVFPACSSLANLSLAGLSWVLIAQLSGHGWSRRDVWWIALICLVVVGVNVGRMSLMAQSPRLFSLWHSKPGEALVNIGVTAVVIAIALLCVRRDIA